MAATAAARHLGDTFRWMFVGEDDTLFFREGAASAVSGLAHDMPYVLADTAWFVGHDNARHYLKAEAPRCVPCGYARSMSLVPPHFVKGCPCKVTGRAPDGFCGPHKMPSMDYFAHGGPGYLMSAGLLHKLAHDKMQGCLAKEEGSTLFGCLWKLGWGITDPDPAWHPEGLTHFDPTPSPFLTHENIMEKSASILGRLLRQAAGMCHDICQTEMARLVSLHLNAARIGFLRAGEKRIGDYKDAGQREFVGQALQRAISRFYASDVLGGAAAAGWAGGEAGDLDRRADGRLTAAKQMIQGMPGVFLGDLLGEGEVNRTADTLAAISTTERARAAVATAVARQAMDIIVQDLTNGAVL